MSIFLALTAAFASNTGACISSVHDGDTLTLCHGERIRLVGIDAPELKGSPRCEKKMRKALASTKHPAWCDYKLANESRDALKYFMGSGYITINRVGTDPYGRTLAEIYIDGRSVSEYLVTWKFAKRWEE